MIKINNKANKIKVNGNRLYSSLNPRTRVKVGEFI